MQIVSPKSIHSTSSCSLKGVPYLLGPQSVLAEAMRSGATRAPQIVCWLGTLGGAGIGQSWLCKLQLTAFQRRPAHHGWQTVSMDCRARYRYGLLFCRLEKLSLPSVCSAFAIALAIAYVPNLQLLQLPAKHAVAPAPAWRHAVSGCCACPDARFGRDNTHVVQIVAAQATCNDVYVIKFMCDVGLAGT